MLRTVRIVFPFAVLVSLTVMGLSIVRYGGNLDVQVGPDNHFRIESPARQEVRQ